MTTKSTKSSTPDLSARIVAINGTPYEEIIAQDKAAEEAKQARKRRTRKAAGVMADLLAAANADPDRIAAQDQTPIDEAAIIAALDASDIAYNTPAEQLQEVDRAALDARGKVVLLLDATTPRPAEEIDAELAQIDDAAAAMRQTIQQQASTPAQTQAQDQTQAPPPRPTRAQEKARRRLEHAAARLAEAQAWYDQAQAAYTAAMQSS